MSPCITEYNRRCTFLNRFYLAALLISEAVVPRSTRIFENWTYKSSIKIYYCPETASMSECLSIFSCFTLLPNWQFLSIDGLKAILSGTQLIQPFPETISCKNYADRFLISLSSIRTVAFITYYLLLVLVLSTNLDHTHHMFHKLLKLLDSKTLSLFMPSITTKPNLGLTL